MCRACGPAAPTSMYRRRQTQTIYSIAPISLLPENSYNPILATSESCFGCVVDRGGLSVASLGNFTLDLGIFDSVPGKDVAFRELGPTLKSMEENRFPYILHSVRVF